MKQQEKLLDAIGMIGDDLIDRAKEPHFKKRTRRSVWISAVAACLALALCLGIAYRFMLSPPAATLPPDIFEGYALAVPEYPECPVFPSLENYGGYTEEYYAQHSLWEAYHADRKNSLDGFDVQALYSFVKKTASEFLNSGDGKNSVYSPINVYVTLAMSAELAKGESRAQILSLLGADDINGLRETSEAIWKNTYIDDNVSKVKLSSSVWLSDNAVFKKKTLDSLSKHYFASSFTGECGSAEYDRIFRKWIETQVGEYCADASLDKDSLITLVSALTFNAKWDSVFSDKAEKRLFSSPSGYTDCEFMTQKFMGDYYYSDRFAAVEVAFRDGYDSGNMLFILPDEGTSPEELLSDEAFYDMVFSNNCPNTHCEIVVTVPKFDVSDGGDISEELKNIGVTDIFDPNRADLSSVSGGNTFVGGFIQSSRVSIDEEGCSAASLVTVPLYGAEAPTGNTAYFTADRPFIFVIRNDSGLPLYIGTVNEP